MSVIGSMSWYVGVFHLASSSSGSPSRLTPAISDANISLLSNQPFTSSIPGLIISQIRFVNEEPYAIYLSEHSAGSAYYWDVVDFDGDRPITYIAYGGHANYVTAGTQDYTIALGIISDKTDAGYLWDMTLNYRGYWYDDDTETFSIASGAGTGATEEDGETADWLEWEGAWGDEQYPDSFLDDLETGQYCVDDECHYSSGPTGPVAKNLGRTTVCQDDSDCTIFDNINDLTTQS
jgi:hypothetical protein